MTTQDLHTEVIHSTNKITFAGWQYKHRNIEIVNEDELIGNAIHNFEILRESTDSKVAHKIIDQEIIWLNEGVIRYFDHFSANKNHALLLSQSMQLNVNTLDYVNLDYLKSITYASRKLSKSKVSK